MEPNAEIPVVNQAGMAIPPGIAGYPNGSQHDNSRDESAQETDNLSADDVGHPHFLSFAGFGNFVGPAIDKHVQSVVNVPHGSAHHAAHTGAGKGQAH